MDLYHYVLFWVCILGLCLGSFYNVVILRSLSNESIVFPASKCPKCGHRLYFWHNIPVVSYILLRGKCYFCKEKISIQYPIVELLTMILFGASFVKYGFSWNSLYVIFILSCLIIMTMTDIKERLVDCNIAIAMGIAGFLYHGDVINSLIGMAAAVVVLELVARLGYLFVGSRAMGEADTYVAGAMGAIFGFPNVGLALIYSLIASLIFIVPLFLYNQYKQNNKSTCILSIFFILSVLIHRTLVQNYLTIAILALFGLLLAISILQNIKTEENRNYLPYVPALACGTLYLLILC